MRLTRGATLLILTYLGLTLWGIIALCDLHPWTAFQAQEYRPDYNLDIRSCAESRGFTVYLKDPDTDLPFQCGHWPK